MAKSLVDALSHFDAQAVIGKALAASAPKIASQIGDQVRRTPEKVATALGIGFGHHLQTTFEKCYKVKTLIYREESVELLSQYVSIKLQKRRSKVTDNYLIENLEEYKNVIIQGSGGSGKTMFMKYLALCRFENPRGRIPLFIELRTLSYGSEKSFERLIFEDSASKKSRLTFEQFEKGLISGLFLVILDGLDEVDPLHRESVYREIGKFPVRYPDNILIISSREDSGLNGWAQFACFNVLPLDKRQVTSVIKKIEFDKTIKAKFLKDLSSFLYDKHKSFLTNPLLATIMLLRYDQFADSGDKIYIFYDQAFETLFFKHDLSKGVYERKRYSAISVDDFRNFFSAFCFATYANNKYAFSRLEIISRIEKSLKYCSLSASPSAVLKDLIESVCIMQEDGLLYTFVHRSFQEYFAALFVSEYRGDKAVEYVAALMLKSSTESAGAILKEMAPRMVDKLWGLPTLEKMTSLFSDRAFVENPGMIILKLCRRLYVSRDGQVDGFGIETLGTECMQLGSYYKLNSTKFLSQKLLFNSKDHLNEVRSRLPEKERLRFVKRISQLSAPNDLINDRVIDEADNYWLVHTNAPGLFNEMAGVFARGASELRDKLESLRAADENLIELNLIEG
ncbi:NACHT domain-containing protein [Sphingomonas sp. BIUV-7]|uniref:NACHT domain-containing protein n=1 Tax=Sphingomonas natans TaxID=3063330 RepID=A0ABT8Y5I7_9SPHN|nr:NACHT domain-containing protein [Sphingomonas sp. BIUV-7]MDO6413571.1 NACHT domain-containing protein [Sphingomonas sp. BIUV-7]